MQPADLAAVLAAHTGIGAHVIAAQSIDGASALSPHHRRAFCPECWVEEGPYRRFEWAHGWSLVCPRHWRLLSERLRTKGPFVHWSEEAWTEFYCDTGAWRDLRPSWQCEPWTRICAYLGVEPRAEFLRAWPWLLELSKPAPTRGRVGNATARPASGRCAAQYGYRPEGRVDELAVKEDLALYGMMQFRDFSLLKALDCKISNGELMADTSGGGLCDVRTPQSPYWVRVFAAVVARHLWAALTQGRWHCGRYEILERAVSRPRRWSDELWWVEQRLRTWPVALEDSGRQLFRRTDPCLLMPPWERCRQCVRDGARADWTAVHVWLPNSWRCLNRDPAVKAECAAILARYTLDAEDNKSAAGLEATAPDW